ncbi:DNA replication complex GINS protein PSF2 [Leptonychotes weddellii]|uniref:DNA replication complex GINS protein PSF2 n=1 Tax=Leptonychotes weddellii TaxID=9713 RepID=A0A2U3XU83_LEPWE|nr:DNA replication complex GINS protein PSF2 [Leptonychotes weddellii]
MDAAEVEFLAEKELVTIIPNFSLDKIYLIGSASDNIPKADEIRTLIKDVWDTRTAKLRVSADSFVRQQEAHAKLDNLTLMEINTSGAFLTQALNHMYKLRTNLQPSESIQSQDF